MHLTVADVAALLRTPPKQIYRWIDEGELDCNWFHDQPRFNRTELLEWATARRLPIAVDQFLDDEGDADHPSLVAGLRAGGIHHGIGGADRASVLRAVVGVMQLPEIEKETLIQVLLAREATGSTGIGDGIAIPHVRQPIVMGGSPASVSLCFLERPVDFCAIDGSPVHTLFLMISTTVRGHLQTLARLSSALGYADFKAAVLRRAPAEEILREAARAETASPLPAGR
ncbi:MAG TPA: PTS sugar transporter subunit IIA [Polyangia bacterium]